MELKKRIENFTSKNHTERLEALRELLDIGSDFINSKTHDQELAKIIAETIMDQRSLMGSSKAYEGALDLDMDLCKIATLIARIAFNNTKPLIGFLESELYYSNYFPDKFNKQQILKEIEEIG